MTTANGDSERAVIRTNQQALAVIAQLLAYDADRLRDDPPGVAEVADHLDRLSAVMYGWAGQQVPGSDER